MCPDLLKTIDRYFQTLRYLRPVQIYGRIWFNLKKAKVNASPAPPRRVVSGPWIPVATRAPSLLSQRDFLFLNQSGSLSEIGWDGGQREKLWRYNQHYFDDLNARASAERATWHLALIEDWIAQNPPGVGVGWEPYPTSLRIVNWVKWALSGNTLSQAALHSLAVQTRWLCQRLEFHLLGNHLFTNAKALVFAGLFFQGPEANGWLKRGTDILSAEIPEQILSDGGQFERSPMYHALALEDMLDLCNVLSSFETRNHTGEGEPADVAQGEEFDQSAELLDFKSLCESRIPGMLAWLKTIQHSDSEISFFNDAALGIAPSCAELEAYASRMGFEVMPISKSSVHLKDSGYCRLQNASAVVLIDIAPIGPDYLPGHAHADTLSFELSLFSKRVFVNSGTSCYGSSPERHRQRGTAAHNTVVLNNQDSSEVWGGFRVARRARVQHARVEQYDEVLVVQAEHDGYQRLSGSPIHARRIELSDHELIVTDTATLSDGKPYKGLAVARFHAHPDLKISLTSRADYSGVIQFSDGKTLSLTVPIAASVRVEPSTWHPRFGESVENQCLVIELLNGESKLKLSF